jgi:hypothetical protein
MVSFKRGVLQLPCLKRHCQASVLPIPGFRYQTAEGLQHFISKQFFV